MPPKGHRGMAPRINWFHKAKALGYESLPVMILDMVRTHGLQRAAVRMGVSESSLYFKKRGLGIGFGKKIYSVFQDWPYIGKIRKAKRKGEVHGRQ